MGSPWKNNAGAKNYGMSSGQNRLPSRMKLMTKPTPTYYEEKEVSITMMNDKDKKNEMYRKYQSAMETEIKDSKTPQKMEWATPLLAMENGIVADACLPSPSSRVAILPSSSWPDQ